MKNQDDRLSLILNFAATVFLCLAAFWFVLFTGCSHILNQVKAAREQAQITYELQRSHTVLTSENDKRPDWTKHTFTENNSTGSVAFSGAFFHGTDYAVSVRCANAEALKVGVQAIGNWIRAEFTEYVQGPNTGALGVDRYVSDGIATYADCLRMQGVRQAEVYYEETFNPATMQPTYNVFVRLEMSKLDYLKTKADVLRRLQKRFDGDGHLKAKERGDELLRQLKDQVGQGA